MSDSTLVTVVCITACVLNGKLIAAWTVIKLPSTDLKGAALRLVNRRNLCDMTVRLE